jgi:YggT family protein
MNLLSQTLIYLIHLYAMFVLLRFFMQYFRVDFYNPLSQSIVKLTNPPLKPLRRLIPGYRGYDLASLTLTYLLGGLALSFNYGFWLSFGIQELIPVLLLMLLQLVYSAVNLFFFLIILRIILSFIMMGQGFTRNPLVEVIFQLTEPIMRPFQRLIPPVGMLDFSPIVIFLLIMFTKNLLLATANWLNPVFTLI